jgi:2-polyprenyl-6-methoxyphenol hydroxylase-like FAD-dependent oxidoreductase
VKLDSLQVVVVGGAIAGSSAALLLARAGAQVTLLERADSVRAVGAGIALAENGLAVLDALGLSSDLERTSTPVTGVRVVDAAGRTLFEPQGGIPGQAPHLLMARRSDLYALLSSALSSEPRIAVHYGVTVERVDDDGTVHAVVGGQPSSFSAALVIGADGVHSRVRTSGSFGARVQPSGISYVRGLAAEGLARGEEAWTRAGLFGSFAVPSGSYWYASLGSQASRRALAARDLPALRAAWATAYAPAQPLLASMTSFEQLLVNDVVRVHCARFYDGPRVLVGDAAHAMAPNLGQGANSALVDAAVLFAELRRADTLDQALAAYDARRRPKVERVANTAARLGKLAELTHPLLRVLRDRVLMPLASLSDGHALTRAAWQEDPATLGALA